MSKFRKSKSKLAVALLGALFCNVNGASAMNSRMNMNKTGMKNSQALGVVEGATSGNTSINNSNNNGDGWVKNHKWQLGIGGLSIATVVTLAIVGGKYLSKKDDDPGKDPNESKKENKENKDKQENQENIQFPYKAANSELMAGAEIPEELSFDCWHAFCKIVNFIVNGGLNSNDACKDIVDALRGIKKLGNFAFRCVKRSGEPLKDTCAAYLDIGGKVCKIGFAIRDSSIEFGIRGKGENNKFNDLSDIIVLPKN